MTVYERIRVLIDQTLVIYDFATFGGTLFTVFALACLYLLVSRRSEDIRIRDSFVLPSVFITLIVLNPIVIHYLRKAINPSRLPRLLWAFPFEFVIVYCVTEAALFFKEKWKRALITLGTLLILFWGADAMVLDHLSLAENAYKVPGYTVELTGLIKAEEDEPSPVVAAPGAVLQWFRQYDTELVIAFGRLQQNEFRDAFDAATVDLDKIGGEFAPQYGCDFIVLDNTRPSTGALEDYGYTPLATVEGRYVLYKHTA